MVQKIADISYKTWLPFLLAGFMALGMIIGHRFSSENLAPSDIEKGIPSKESNFLSVQEVFKYIDSRYVDSIESKELSEAATIAVLERLDPHSVYISPEELDRINQGMSGYYKGMGIETIHLNDTLRVIKVIPESPAEKGGVLYGDKFLKANDSILVGKNRTKEEQWALLKTVDQEKFEVEILRGTDDIKNLTIIPSQIKSPNVTYFDYEGVGYINILRFSDQTYEGFIDALEHLQKDKVISKLILDLRDNPGGYLPEATKILNQFFVEDKRLLVYTEDRTKRTSEYNTTGRPFYQIDKLAVLVNEGSASASEVIAGALQDWDKAIIIGESTFGKGLVQEQFTLSNGGAIRLTTARYYTPSGRSIQKPYEQFDKDTIQNFYSKEFERSLTSNGGIHPDYTVNWTPTQMELLNIVSENISTTSYHIIQKLTNNKGTIELTQAKDVIYSYLKEHFDFTPIELEFASKYVFFSIVDQLNSKEYIGQAIFDFDVFVQKAYEKLSVEDIFAELKK